MYSFSPSPSPAPASPPPNSHLYSPGGANHPSQGGSANGAAGGGGGGGGGVGAAGGAGAGVSNAGQSHAAQQQRYSLLSKLQQQPHGHYGQHHASLLSLSLSFSRGSPCPGGLVMYSAADLSESAAAPPYPLAVRSSRSVGLLRRRIRTARTRTTPLPSPLTLNITPRLTSRTVYRQGVCKVHRLRLPIITWREVAVAAVVAAAAVPVKVVVVAAQAAAAATTRPTRSGHRSRSRTVDRSRRTGRPSSPSRRRPAQPTRRTTMPARRTSPPVGRPPTRSRSRTRTDPRVRPAVQHQQEEEVVAAAS